jgi:hypothetical protein
VRRANTIAFACGRKGSGKSYWLEHEFVVRAPRVVHIDPNGDYLDDAGVLVVDGYTGLLTALEAFAAVNQREWRVAVSLSENETVEFFQLVAPLEDFGRGSLSRAFGGMAIECGECDVIAPNGRTHPAVASAWRRGRHHQLDLYMGTQRPAACDRLLTSMADVVACFSLDEPRDVTWVTDKMGRAAADEVVRLPEHWHVEKRQGSADVRVIDTAGRTVRQLSAITIRARTAAD